MKQRDLKKKAEEMGWYLDRQGANHEWWTDGKGNFEAIPRHNEINEILAKKILKAMAKKLK